MRTIIELKLPKEPATAERSLVIRFDEKKEEYVVHYYNHDENGYYQGYYTSSLELALKEYERRLSYHLDNYSVWLEKFFVLRDRVFSISESIYTLSKLMKESLIESKMIENDVEK